MENMMQERYHEYIKRQFKLDRDRQDHMEHSPDLERQRSSKEDYHSDSNETIQMD